MESLLNKGKKSADESSEKYLSGIGSKDGRRNKYDNIHMDDLDDLVMSTEVVGGRDTSGIGRDYPVNAIKMTNTFNVV